ncbi:sulfatase [Verrucomicrobiaceae bacterium R5-34]|nr:sulfatase [Verrucomicrobiaceae bacterium R5-34]
MTIAPAPLRVALGLVTAVSLPSMVAANPSAEDQLEKPNVVVIFTDDQGYGDLSCFGGEYVKTPRIDQMAAEGAKLTSFYVAGNVCTPSRAALMTGCYPKRVGLANGVFLAGDQHGLHPDEVTIAEVLKKAGYRTGIFGKWHLGDQPEFLPTRQGFDEFFGLPYSHDIHPYHTNKKHRFPPLPLMEMEKVVEQDPDADYLTQRITERAVDFISRHKGEPFFLYIPHPIPHRPIHMSPPFMKQVPDSIRAKLKDEKEVDYKTRDQMYRHAISEIDWSVGQVLDALKKHGIDDKTLVIFTSDNGPSVGNTGPFTGAKGSTYEGGQRVPAVMRWPGHIPAGQEIDELVTAMDLLPTLARIAGGELPSDRTIDGKDVRTVLTDQTPSSHQAFFYFKGNRLKAVRSGPWKLHFGKLGGKASVRRGKGASSSVMALYHLEKDPAENHNVLDAHPDLVAKLSGYADRFQAELNKNLRSSGLVPDPKTLTKRN